jgi:hypothetical protein
MEVECGGCELRVGEEVAHGHCARGSPVEVERGGWAGQTCEVNTKEVGQYPLHTQAAFELHGSGNDGVNAHSECSQQSCETDMHSECLWGCVCEGCMQQMSAEELCGKCARMCASQMREVKASMGCASTSCEGEACSGCTLGVRGG